MDDQPTLPSSYRSFVAYGGYDEPYAPAFKKLLLTEVDTHTHTHTHTHGAALRRSRGGPE